MFTLPPFVDAPPPALQPPPAPHPSKAGQLTLSMPASADGPLPLLPVFPPASDMATPLTGASFSHATVAFCVAGSRTSRCSGVSLEHCAAASIATTAKPAMHDSLCSLESAAAKRRGSTATATEEAPTKVFVGQLPQRPDVQPWLEALFKPYGVQEVQVRRVTAFDKRGEAWEKPVAAFVWVKTREAAEVAVAKLHHHEYKNGRLWFKLSVEMAHSSVPPSPPLAPHS